MKTSPCTTGTILLVEDDPDEEALTLRALGRGPATYDVVVVRDGAEVLDYLAGKGAYADRDATLLPAVVLLDINIPKVNGLEVLRRIRNDEQTRSLPVVILSSSNDQQDLVGGQNAGANSYVRKPVDFTAFAELIRNVAHYWTEINQAVPD